MELLVASPHTYWVYAVRASLCVGSRASQLMLVLLVGGFLLPLVLQCLCQLSREMPMARCQLERVSETLKDREDQQILSDVLLELVLGLVSYISNLY